MNKIGTLVTNTGEFVGIKPSDIGLCLHRLDETNMYLFENGFYDGFSKEEENTFLKPITLINEFNYEFKNVIQLNHEYKRSAFKPFFDVAHIKLSEMPNDDKELNIMEIL